MKKICIIVPCYNEENALPYFYSEIKKHLNNHYAFTILFVNDGSVDKTLNVIKALQKEDSIINYIDFSKNFGKESAMYAGLMGAKTLESDAAIFMDADLQDPPHLIHDMLKYYEEGYLHIYAKHASRKNEPFIKTFFAMQFYKLYTIITKEKNLEKGVRDFSLLDKKVIEAFISVKDTKRFTKGIFTWVGFEKKCIEFDYIPRVAGKTKWSFNKLFKYGIDGINQFSQMYKIVTKFAVLFSIFVLLYDMFTSLYQSTLNIKDILFNVLNVLIFLALHAIITVVYDVKDQVMHRPKFIVKNSSIEGLHDID